MIENPCNKCEWFTTYKDLKDTPSPYSDYCRCGSWIDDDVYGRKWVYKYQGLIVAQRKQCQGKDFVPHKSLWRRFIDWIKGGSE